MNRKKKWAIVSAAVVLIVLLVLIVMILPKTDPDNTPEGKNESDVQTTEKKEDVQDESLDIGDWFADDEKSRKPGTEEEKEESEFKSSVEDSKLMDSGVNSENWGPIY